MSRLRRVGEGTYVLPGSPATLIYASGGEGWLVDPGQPRSRAREVVGALSSLGVRAALAAISHSHSDHVAAVPDLAAAAGVPVLCPEEEYSPAISPGLRRAMSFGARAPEGLVYHVEAVPARPDGTFRHGDRLGPLETVPLRGHTFGMAGFVTPDGILYAADSFFGDRLLARAVIPYHLDFRGALDTVRWLLDGVRDYEKLVPSHGPVVDGAAAERMLEVNLRILEGLPGKIESALRAGPASAGEVTARILLEGGAELTPSSVILGSVTVRSALGYMAEDGTVSPVAGPRGLLWRLA